MDRAIKKLGKNSCPDGSLHSSLEKQIISKELCRQSVGEKGCGEEENTHLLQLTLSSATTELDFCGYLSKTVKRADSTVVVSCLVVSDSCDLREL